MCTGWRHWSTADCRGATYSTLSLFHFSIVRNSLERLRRDRIVALPLTRDVVFRHTGITAIPLREDVDDVGDHIAWLVNA